MTRSVFVINKQAQPKPVLESPGPVRRAAVNQGTVRPGEHIECPSCGGRHRVGFAVVSGMLLNSYYCGSKCIIGSTNMRPVVYITVDQWKAAWSNYA